MSELNVSAPPTNFLPLWARIAFACFMFAVAALQMWTEFFRFNWIQFACLGLYYILFVPMQRGESRKAYFSKPRTIISLVLIIVIVACALHLLFTKFAR
jgi:hypothetical protein